MIFFANLILFLVCLGAAAAGTGLAWTSPVLDQLKKDDSKIPTGDEQATWIASMLAIGAICGALPCGILADKIGRKKAALVIAVPYIVSYVLTVFASSVFTLYVARFLIGNLNDSSKAFTISLNQFLTKTGTKLATHLNRLFSFFHILLLFRYCDWWLVCCSTGFH